MTEMSREKMCPSCDGENIKTLSKIEILLPTPSNEIIFSPGSSPKYSTDLKLPFDYCADCGTVIYRDYKKE